MNLRDIRSIDLCDLFLRLLHGEQERKQWRVRATEVFVGHRVKQILRPRDPALLSVSKSNKELHGGADGRVAAVIHDGVDLVLVVVEQRNPFRLLPRSEKHFQPLHVESVNSFDTEVSALDVVLVLRDDLEGTGEAECELAGQRRVDCALKKHKVSRLVLVLQRGALAATALVNESALELPRSLPKRAQIIIKQPHESLRSVSSLCGLGQTQVRAVFCPEVGVERCHVGLMAHL
mmetsp:Transcript_54426/g.95035  ORF Transcript_54426/g.95035 Transcript_54426/m.95035 type:complete len:234 (-) Transcript_54426:1234-1935(-)